MWADPVVREGGVGTPMIVHPRYDDLPLWVDVSPHTRLTTAFASNVKLADAHGVVCGPRMGVRYFALSPR